MATQRLIDWANAQDPWVRSVTAEALATGKPLGEAAIARALAALLVEKQLAPGQPPVVAPLVAGAPAEDTAEALRLVKLRDVAGVNALAASQEIAFSPRLTVLYGENAAGKTGYARILKRVAGGRSAEAVLPSFRAEAPEPQRATLEYTLGGRAQTLEWQDEAGVAPLTRMSVFDSRSVSVHVDDDLTYVFTPSDLALYRHVHQALDAVRAKLDAQVAEARPKANPFVPLFKRDAKVFPLIEALAATTPLDELRALAGADEDRLEALRDQAEALRPEASKGRLQAAVTDTEFYGALAGLAGALRALDWAGYHDAVSRLLEANAAREKSADETFEDDEIPGAQLASWHAFIEAAEAYLGEMGEKTYPHRGDDCLYCRQPLKPPATALIKRYRAHVRDSSQTELETASQDHAQRAAKIAALPIASVAASVLKRVQLADDGQVPAVLLAASVLLELAVPLQQAAAKGRAAEPGQLPKVAREVEDAATAARRAAEEIIVALKKQATERQRALDDVTGQVRELENRLVLKAQLPELEAFVTRAKWATAAAAVSTRITGVLRGLTEQSKAANEEALNPDFERLFLAECEALRAPPVKLDFAGRKGQAARKKLLAPSHRLSEVLSEGEQSVIALADFLAEVSLRASPAPVVFDDPVNSLDHLRMEHVVDRLVGLSATRQVIVFTHHLGFASALAARAPSAFYEVRAEDGRAGFVRERTAG